MASSYFHNSSLYPSATDPCFAKRPIAVCGRQISPWWHNDFVPHKGDLTCSACLSVARRLCSSNPASVSLLSNTSGDASSVSCQCVCVTRPHVRGNPPQSYLILSILMRPLLWVFYLFSSAWFLLAIHYSCFLHTQLPLPFKLFLMLSFYFPPSSPLVFAPSSALMSQCRPSPAVWTRWVGMDSDFLLEISLKCFQTQSNLNTFHGQGSPYVCTLNSPRSESDRIFNEKSPTAMKTYFDIPFNPCQIVIILYI